jgi:aminomethyltransferase
MMSRNVCPRREAMDERPTHDPLRETPGSRKPGAEGATAPETLRQKDRKGDDLLENRRALARLTEGVTRNIRGNLSGPMTEGCGSGYGGPSRTQGTDVTSNDNTEQLRRTPLYALHLELGGKMVPFAGYEMPVQYPAGILKEHLHTRASAGLFDVSHMGQAFLSGDDPVRALERVTPADVARLKEGMQRYGLLLNPDGGIRDDFMFSRLTGERDLYVVVNAGTKEGDFAYITEKLNGAATLTPRPDRALLALQGPKAGTVLERLSPGIDQLTFMNVVRTTVAGAPAIVSRSGYTGEDGFEISLEGSDAERVARALLAEAEVLPIGLGARDSLRLEAGLCLYGHDMDETTDPVEANLMWSIGKRRKTDKDFPAADKIMDRVLNGAPTKRIGIRPEGRAPAREGAEIADKDGRVIGRITSGGFGPSLNAPMAMGYVERAYSTDGTKLDLLVRGKALPAEVAPMPFVPHRYKRAKAGAS